MNALMEQEKKSRLKSGTLVVGRADFEAENDDVSVKLKTLFFTCIFECTGLAIWNC